MRLTEKDREFLALLRKLMEEDDLSVELKEDGRKRMILRKNYGSRIESKFGLSRQGVRWRFHRIFSEQYVEAYAAILWIESRFGTHLREKAMAIAKERHRMSSAGQENGIDR